jgi:hypothetical protein
VQGLEFPQQAGDLLQVASVVFQTYGCNHSEQETLSKLVA